jgi:hypothetical protein
MATPIETQKKDLKELNAIISLARLGTDKVILNHLREKIDYRGIIGLINRYYTPIGAAHRKGSYWLRSLSGRIIGDRLLRLFSGIYSFEKVQDELSAPQLLKLFTLYHAMWPADEISTNRIHYYFLAIRSQDVIALPRCPCCEQPFVFHKEDGGLFCSACEGMKLAKSRADRLRAQEERARQEALKQQQAADGEDTPSPHEDKPNASSVKKTTAA